LPPRIAQRIQFRLRNNKTEAQEELPHRTVGKIEAANSFQFGKRPVESHALLALFLA
jgi:hypothetical protein